ncbi:hypothetical protein F8388_016013 [Cannabis sativa]|uniref:hAT-like transposase RNase-H fold domain-containing protein n=1 Tax=Cannabis sativa TaxID=3483 RepID=A0A7J6FV19_CANSA|nr:hypothetical protein F8388_016013 [Cannabis sativa]
MRLRIFSGPLEPKSGTSRTRIHLNYKAYFEEFDKDGNSGDKSPIELSWENAKIFVRFFRAFHKITMKFSDSTYITSNKYFITISRIQQQLYKLSLAENDDIFLVSMAKSIKEKYDKYWGRTNK